MSLKGSKKTHDQKYIEIDQFHKLLKVCKTIEDEAFITTMAMLGLRCGELLLLKRTDFDFINNRVTVSTLKQKGHPKHTIYFDPRLGVSLYRFILSNFPPYKGNMMRYYHRFKKLCKWAGLPSYISTHALRHFHGMLVSKVTKGDRAAIGFALRHSFETDAMSFYTHVEQSVQIENAKKVYDCVFVKESI